MRLGLVTYNVAKDWDIEKIITTLEPLGYEAVELRSTHAHGVEPGISEDRIRQVRDRFARSTVRLLSLGSACEFHSTDEAERRKNVEEAKAFLELAHDLGCWGVKVRPNGLPEDVPADTTIRRIGEALQVLGEYGARYGVETWVEVHGKDTKEPQRMREIMDACGHPQVGVCWNSNLDEVRDGSIAYAFELLKDHIMNVHINRITKYPTREFFGLLRSIGYQRYCLGELQESCEPERFLEYYKALFDEYARG